MNLNLSLPAIPVDVARLTKEERALIERARVAVLPLDHRFTDKEGTTFLVEAVIFEDPLRIDFRVYILDLKPDAHTFIGPQETLSVELFKGEQLRPSIVEEIRDGFEQFCVYWEKQPK